MSKQETIPQILLTDKRVCVGLTSTQFIQVYGKAAKFYGYQLSRKKDQDRFLTLLTLNN